MRARVPLRQRRGDLIFVMFFLVNLGFITYFVDIEQLTVADPAHFSYPAWPPPWAVDLVHWYANRYDPLVLARPQWFQMTIWVDVVYFGPFYLLAIIAFLRGRDWIRVPALVWSGMMISNVVIILGEERYGSTPTTHWWLVASLNAPWLLLPFAVIFRMRRDHPFTRPIAPPVQPVVEPAVASAVGREPAVERTGDPESTGAGAA